MSFLWGNWSNSKGRMEKDDFVMIENEKQNVYSNISNTITVNKSSTLSESQTHVDTSIEILKQELLALREQYKKDIHIKDQHIEQYKRLMKQTYDICKERIESLDKEIQNYKNQIDESNQSVESFKTKYDELNLKYEEEKKDLLDQLDSLKDMMKESEDYKKSLEVQNIEITKQFEQLNEEHQKILHSYEQLVNTQQKTIHDMKILETKFTLISQEKLEMETKFNFTVEEYNQYKFDNCKINSKIEELEERMKNLKERYETLEIENHDLEENYDEIDDENTKLIAENNSILIKNEELEEECSNLNQEREEMLHYIEELKLSNQEVKILLDEEQKNKLQLIDYITSVQNDNKDLLHEFQFYQSKTEELQSKNEGLESKIKEMENNHEQLFSDYEQMNKKCVDMEVLTVEKNNIILDNQRLQQYSESVYNENLLLRAQLTQEKQWKSEMSKKIERLEIENKEIQFQLDERIRMNEIYCSDLENYKTQLKNFESHLSNEKYSLEKLREESDFARLEDQNQISELLSNLKIIKSENDQMKKREIELVVEIEDWKSKFEETEHYSLKLIESKKMIEKMKEEISQYNLLIQENKKKLDFELKEKKRIEKSLDDATMNYIVKNERCMAMEKEIFDMKKCIQEKNNKIEDLNVELTEEKTRFKYNFQNPVYNFGTHDDTTPLKKKDHSSIQINNENRNENEDEIKKKLLFFCCLFDGFRWSGLQMSK